MEAVSGFGRFRGCGIAAAAVRSSRLSTRRASSPYVARSPLSLAVCTSSRKLVYRSASTCSQGNNERLGYPTQHTVAVQWYQTQKWGAEALLAPCLR